MIESRGAVGAVAAFGATSPRNRAHDPIRPFQSYVADLVIAAVGHQQTTVAGNRNTVRIVKASQRVAPIHVATHPGEPGDGPDHPVRSRLRYITDRMVACVRHK